MTKASSPAPPLQRWTRDSLAILTRMWAYCRQARMSAMHQIQRRGELLDVRTCQAHDSAFIPQRRRSTATRSRNPFPSGTRPTRPHLPPQISRLTLPRPYRHRSGRGSRPPGPRTIFHRAWASRRPRTSAGRDRLDRISRAGSSCMMTRRLAWMRLWRCAG